MRDQAARRFDELTDDEVVGLTDEQVERFIDYECAMKGVPLLPVGVPVAPEKVQPLKDVEVFVVGGFMFPTSEVALEVAQFVASKPRMKTEYAPGGNYSNQIAQVEDDKDVVVQSVRHYSPEQWSREKAAVTSHQDAQQNYERERREYDAIVTKRNEAAREILNRLRDARDFVWRRDQLQHEFDRYVGLANGDRAVAARFLKNAHYDAQDVLPELFVSEAPAEVVAEMDVAAAAFAASSATEGGSDDELFF